MSKGNDYQIALAVKKNIGKSSEEIKKLLISSSLSCCFINPKLVIDEFQVRHAISLALANRSGELKTRNIFTEILYCLSPTKKIGDSLKAFGLGDDSTSALIVTIDDPSGEQLSETVNQINWEVVNISELSEHSDLTFIQKHYKVKPSELSVGTLSEAVINRMSCKELFNF